MRLHWLSDNDHPAAERWLADRIPWLRNGSIGEAQYAMVGERGRGVAAIVAFHQWDADAGTMQLSMAADSPRWATRRTLRRIFAYAFEEAKARRVWSMTPATNDNALRLLEGLGMVQEASIREHYGPGVAGVVYGMTVSEWQRSPWSGENGKKDKDA